MENYQKAQKFLQQENIDGWLLYYFDHNNPHAFNFLQLLPTSHVSRRVFYWIPMQGEPVKIVHAIEEHVLSHLPGATVVYDCLSSLDKALKSILSKAKRVAMEYSSCNSLPYISKVDAGTVEMVEKHGCNVVSSAFFLLHFTSILSLKQIKMQQEAAKFLEKAAKQIFFELERALWKGQKISEYHVQQKILEYFVKEGFFTEHAPIVAFGKNTANPHYSPHPDSCAILEANMPIMLDIFCKLDKPEAIYADITKMGYSSHGPSPEYIKVFRVAQHAQQVAYDLLCQRLQQGLSVKGYELDKNAREAIAAHNMGEYFRHRLGHNIHETLHGPGTHLDSFETFDDRPLVPSTCFSIEPGVYFPGKFGVRLEYDVLIMPDSTCSIQGGQQSYPFTFSSDKKALTTAPFIL
jgi:Xaa-Pro dipeptidase